MSWGRAAGRGVLAAAGVSLGLASGACRKETIATVDGGKPSTFTPLGGARGGDSRFLGKDRSEPAAGERFLVKLERSECYGLCPAYVVEIGSDGAVAYDGKAFVALRGRATSRIDRAATAALAERFEKEGFFQLAWKDPCGAVATDSPTSTITVVHGGRKRTIVDYHGNGCMPPVLRDLEVEVDRVARTAAWVKCDADSCER